MTTSSCCGAKLLVKGSDEGTNYYVCQACGKPCDGVEGKKCDCTSFSGGAGCSPGGGGGAGAASSGFGGGAGKTGKATYGGGCGNCSSKHLDIEGKKCYWCGKTMDEHENDYVGRPTPRVPCLLLKSNFSFPDVKSANVTTTQAAEWEKGVEKYVSDNSIDLSIHAHWLLPELKSLITRLIKESEERGREECRLQERNRILEGIEGMKSKCTCGCDFKDGCLCKEERVGFKKALSDIKKLINLK